MTQTLTLNTGEIRLKVKNQHGESLGDLVFNPTDLVWSEKYTNFVYSLHEREKDYAEKVTELSARVDQRNKQREALMNGDEPHKDKVNELLEKNKEDTDEAYRLLNKEMDYVRKKIDDLFGDGTYSSLFGDVKSLDGLLSFFSQTMKFFGEARQEAVEKYMPNKKQSRKRHKK